MILLLKKLRIILKSNYLIVLLFLLALISISFYITNDSKSIFNGDEKNFNCTVNNINENNNLYLDCGEYLTGIIEDNNSIEIGDIIKIDGTLKEYESNRNFNTFNYKDYKKTNNEYYRVIINKYQKMGKSNNITLNIKRIINNRIKNLESYNYLKTFILGDKSNIDDSKIEIYRKIGIIHLFSISGMHLSFIVDLINNLYKSENRKKDIIVFIILFFYYLLIKSISLLRSIVFFFIILFC